MSIPTSNSHEPGPNPETAPAPPPAAAAPARVRAPRPSLLEFLAGAPAILALIATVAVLAAARTRTPTIKQYEAELSRRQAKKDFPGALVCMRRLVAMEPSRVDRRFDMAMLLAQTKAFDRADAIARSLAPADKVGYPPAHMWMAQRYLADPETLRQTYPLVESHLKQFIDATDAKNARGGKAMLGQFYLMIGKKKEARQLLEETLDDGPNSLFQLAKVCDDLKDPESAAKYNEAAIKSAKARLDKTPDDRDALSVWAGSAANLRRFDESIEVLDRAYEQTKDDRFTATKGAVYAFWSSTLANSPGDPAAKTTRRISLIEKGLAADPKNTELLMQLSRMMQNQKTGPDAERAREVLGGMLTEGKSTSLVHFLLGNDAWTRKEHARARFHWEEAYKSEPKLPIVANNLAYSLAFQEPTDPKRADSLVEEGLSLAAKMPEITAQLRGTRGQILVKQGKWNEGITDLEFALNNRQNTPGIHTSLADAYQHIGGMNDLAEKHRKAAERLSGTVPR